MDVPLHERITDPLFGRAVDLLDAGDAASLRALLAEHPHLVRQTVTLEPGYFYNPSLLCFCAENPTRRNALPPTIVKATRVILDAGPDIEHIHYTLALVSSGRIARECHVQVPLIDLLCSYGAIPDRAMQAALTHGEFAAVEALLRRGATVDLPTAAALGRFEQTRALLDGASAAARHQATALAAQHGRVETLRLLLDAGEDPNRYNPPNCHSHTMPLHQAVYFGHLDAVRLLVERGARLDVKDTMFDGTPLGWAECCNQPKIAEYLRSITLRGE
jgi:ankyrin repeat protein